MSLFAPRRTTAARRPRRRPSWQALLPAGGGSSQLDKFHRDLVRLDDSTGPVPVLGRSHVDDVGAPEDGEFALEEPEGFGAGTERFVSMEMLFENVAEGGRIT